MLKSVPSSTPLYSFPPDSVSSYHLHFFFHIDFGPCKAEKHWSSSPLDLLLMVADTHPCKSPRVDPALWTSPQSLWGSGSGTEVLELVLAGWGRGLGVEQGFPRNLQGSDAASRQPLLTGGFLLLLLFLFVCFCLDLASFCKEGLASLCQ